MTAMRMTSALGSSLGTLGNIALTWEGQAAKIAGRFGMAGSLVAGLLEVLVPPQDPPPPATKQQLDQALADLKSDLLDVIWGNTASTVQHNVNGFNDDFQPKWDDLTKIKLEQVKDASGKAVGSRPVFDQTDQLTVATVETADGYYYPKGTSALALDTYRRDVEDADFNDGKRTAAELAQKQTQALQLYIMIGSLQVSYYQASIAWRWGQEMLLASQVTCYRKDHDDWTTQCLAKPAYANANPEADLLNPYPELKAKLARKADYLTGYRPPDWGSWSGEAGSPVQQLKDQVDSLLAYCLNGKAANQAGYYTDLRKRWDALETAATANDFPVSAAKPLSPMLFTGIALGFDRAKRWSQAVVDNHLQNLVEDDVLSFAKALDAWRTVRASVSFHYYTTVTASESFRTVATAQYADSTLAAKIAAYNPDVQAGVNDALPVGTTLKIFDKAWLPYVDTAKELWPRPALQPKNN